MKRHLRLWAQLCLLMTLISTAPGLSQTPRQPYLILISLDGFRWDYANRGLTPTLDRFARDGVSALSLQPVFPSKTFPNHISLVTGLHPENHGIILNHFENPFTEERYRLGDSVSVRDAKWYQGEAFWETAERQGIKCASYFWPGSELQSAHRRPTYREAYEHRRPFPERIRGVLNWLKLPEAERPHFITLYFHEVDSRGHRYGPHSPEVNQSIQRMDSLLAMLLTGLEEQNMLDKTNILLTSDHGMTEVDTVRLIDVEAIVGNYPCRYSDYGPVLMVQPLDKDVEAVYQRLKSAEDHFTTYKRSEVPDYFNFSGHPFISPIVLIADMGWTVSDSKGVRRLKRRPGGGNHGFDNYHTDMHGLFYAMGPAFKKGYRTGTVRTLDIYPLMCKIFGIFPRQNIDGDLNRIGFILR